MKIDETIFPDMPQFRINDWNDDGMIMRLERPCRIMTSAGMVTIPAGFLTDGLSIPRFAWPIVGPATGAAFLAGLLHDFLYSRDSNGIFEVSREKADELFREAMFNLGIGFKRNLIWSAVRLFGWRFYKK